MRKKIDSAELIGFVHPTGKGASVITPLFLKRGRFFVQKINAEGFVEAFTEVTLRGLIFPPNLGRPRVEIGLKELFAYYISANELLYGDKSDVIEKLKILKTSDRLPDETLDQIRRFLDPNYSAPTKSTAIGDMVVRDQKVRRDSSNMKITIVQTGKIGGEYTVCAAIDDEKLISNMARTAMTLSDAGMKFERPFSVARPSKPKYEMRKELIYGES